MSPRVRDYAIVLSPRGDAIRVRFATEGAEVVTFTVQYEAMIEGIVYPVVRFDGSHGRPHRDLLDWKGTTVRKDWMVSGTANNEALTWAIKDISTLWERYRGDFLERKP